MESEATSPNRKPPSFFTNVQSQIKINPKNTTLKKKISDNLNELKTYESILIQELENSLKKPAQIAEQESVKLDSGSSFILFILKEKNFSCLIPDVELRKYKKVCIDMIDKLNNHEGHFGLARLLIHENLYEESEKHLNTAISEEKNSGFYEIWLAVLKALSCDTKAKAVEGQKYIESLLNKYRHSIELWWALLHISLQDFLSPKNEIKSPQCIASKLKALDSFYGYLAWGEVLGKSPVPGHKEKFIVLLTQLTLNYPSRPEAYIKLWYFYYSTWDYTHALEVAENAFLNVPENSEYAVVVNLNYAKSLMKCEKFRKCFELLQCLYRKHSHFSVYLYQYGRMCLKSKDDCFIGSAIGALEECLMICNDFRHGSIYYWLMEGYLKGGDKVKANEYAKTGSSIINSELQKINPFLQKNQNTKLYQKMTKMRDLTRKLHMDILNIEILEKILENFNPSQLEEAKLHCNKVSKFDPVEGGIYWSRLQKISDSAERSLETLYSLLPQTSITMKHFFLLCGFLKSQDKHQEILNISKDMLKRCKSPLIPVQVWISIHKIYIKSLVKLNLYEKAILMLKTLAQVHPPPFIPDLNYLKQLQFATSKTQLEHAVDRLSLNIEDYELRATVLLRARLMISKKNLSSIIIDDQDTDLGSAVSDSHSDSEEIGCRTPDPLPKARISKIPLGDGANNGFSVSMNYKFLYLIGKFAGKYQICVEDGYCAIHDFLNIHHYWMREGMESDEIMQVKAQYWQGVLMYLKKEVEAAISIFREIYSMLFQLNFEKMTSQIDIFFKEYQGN